MNQTMKSLVVAWLVIIGAGVAFVTATQVARLSPEARRPSARQNAKASLPADIPLYDGASLDKAVKTESDSRVSFRYLIPLASTITVRTFYEEKMKAEGWTLYVQSGRSLSFYKDKGERRASLGLGSEPGRVVLTIEVE